VLGMTKSQEQDSDSLLRLAQSLHKHFMILELTLGVQSRTFWAAAVCVVSFAKGGTS